MPRHNQPRPLGPVPEPLLDRLDQLILESFQISFRQLKGEILRKMKMNDVVLTLHVPECVAALFDVAQRGQRTVEVDKESVLRKRDARNEYAQIVGAAYASDEAYSYS